MLGMMLRKLERSLKKFESLKWESVGRRSPFQADPSIADIALRGGCEAILSGDSDFAMYVGPGGPDNLSDIMLRDIKINKTIYHLQLCIGYRTEGCCE